MRFLEHFLSQTQGSLHIISSSIPPVQGRHSSIPQAPALLLTGHWKSRDHEILTEFCVFQGTLRFGRAGGGHGGWADETQRREQISAAMLEEVETS